MTAPAFVDSTARTLRDEFDQSFARAAVIAKDDAESVLTIRIAGDGYAIRLADIAGIAVNPTVVPIPTSQPALLGLAGIRGDIVPVFGLSTLLGYGRESNAMRWIVVCGTSEPIAFAFTEFEGHRLVRRTDVFADAQPRNEYLLELMNSATGVRGVVSVPRIVTAIQHRRMRLLAEERR